MARRSRRNWTAMKTTTFLREQLREITADIAQAKADGKAWTAIAQMRRLTIDIRRELDELERQQREEPPEQKLSDEELAAVLVQAIADMPDDLLDLVEDAVRQRRGPALRVVDGGA